MALVFGVKVKPMRYEESATATACKAFSRKTKRHNSCPWHAQESILLQGIVSFWYGVRVIAFRVKISVMSVTTVKLVHLLVFATMLICVSRWLLKHVVERSEVECPHAGREVFKFERKLK